MIQRVLLGGFFILSSLQAAPIRFPFYDNIGLGDRTIPAMLTQSEALHLSHTPECKKSDKPLGVSDKFTEVSRHLQEGTCWALQQIAQARPIAPQFSPDLKEFLSPDQLSDALLPPRAPGDDVEARRDEWGITIAAGPRDQAHMPGYVARFQPISRGDFTHNGSEEVMGRRSVFPAGSTFEDCEMVIVGRKSGGKIEVRLQRPIGRCA